MVSKKQMQNAQDERELAKGEKMSAKKIILLILGVLGAGMVRAIAVYIFIVPNEFAPGGITGIASMLSNKLPGNPNAGYFLFAINIPLIIIAFIFLGKRFGIISSGAIILSTCFMLLFEHIPGFENIVCKAADPNGADRVLYALAGGIIGGVGIALMLKLGGSNGGTDIIATIVQKKYSATNVAWFIFILDSSVVIVSFFVYDFSIVPVLLSFVEMFASGKVTETILQGFKSALKFEIITSHAEEISREIIEKLHRGVTATSAKGMYTGAERTKLVCILRKRQLSQLREILKKYPDTFAYVSGTSEVVGKGFTNQ